MRRLEKLLLAAGLVLLAVYAAVRIHSEVSSRLAVQKFEAARQEARQNAEVKVKSETGKAVDLSLWSELRVKEYLSSLTSSTDAPLAVLRIPKLHLEVPVFDGTDDLTLNRGIGRIIGTARLGQTGNIGLAGHRDGFFRGLKDIGPGDVMELEMPGRMELYKVTEIQITNPDDVSVLKPTPSSTLTLVTCYPFYFVGSAPQRYIVHASISESNKLNAGSTISLKENLK
jgi:sortase A